MKKLTLKEAAEVLKDADLSSSKDPVDLTNILTPIDFMKIKICGEIIRYQKDHKLSVSNLAIKLKISESKVSNINTRSIKKLELEELLNFAYLLQDDSNIRRSLLLLDRSFNDVD